MSGSLIALAACCTLLAHLAVETASPALTVASLAAAAALVLIPGMARGSPRAWMAPLLAGGALALACCSVPDGVLTLLGLTPPLAVPQTLWSWFANVASSSNTEPRRSRT